jgi:predicted esterase
MAVALAPSQAPKWKLPYEVVELPVKPAALKQRLKNANHAVWQEGDVLTFLYRSSEDLVRVTGSVQKPMSHIEGTDLWVLRLRMQGWDSLLVAYSFYTPEGSGKKLYWRGKNAPEPVVKASSLQGQILERSIASTYLQEERKLTVYMPPGTPKQDIPALFMADGQDCKGFAAVLEPLILKGKVRPVAIVGVHNGGFRGPNGVFSRETDFRAKEYVPGVDEDRFGKHLRFFAEEVPAWAAKELGVSVARNDRAVFGYSNGAAFAQSIATRRPEVFGYSMPLSTGIPLPAAKPESALPEFYYAAGMLEAFIGPTTASYKQVLAWGGKAEMRTYFSGHEESTWTAGFADLVPRIFPPR